MPVRVLLELRHANYAQLRQSLSLPPRDVLYVPLSVANLAKDLDIEDGVVHLVAIFVVSLKGLCPTTHCTLRQPKLPLSRSVTRVLLSIHHTPL